MADEIELQGMDELLNRLQLVCDKANSVQNQALKAAAQPLGDEMKSLVKVSTINHTHVRDDIQISGVKTKDGVKFIEVGPGKKTNWRAKFLEFGTTKMSAEPFVQPAFEHTKQEINDILEQKLREALGLG